MEELFDLLELNDMNEDEQEEFISNVRKNLLALLDIKYAEEDLKEKKKAAYDSLQFVLFGEKREVKDNKKLFTKLIKPHVNRVVKQLYSNKKEVISKEDLTISESLMEIVQNSKE